MPSKIRPQRWLSPNKLGALVAKRFDIWQMGFLSPAELSRHARDRAVYFSDEHIVSLWRLGLLRADLVVSTRKLQRSGLVHVGTDDDGRFLYADERPVRRRTKGWVGAVRRFEDEPSHLRLLFHPFRYYVLYHLLRSIEPNVAPIQMLIAEDRYHHLVAHMLSSFQRWSASRDFSGDVERWNDITALAVATEPFTYETLFGRLSWPAGVGEAEHRKVLAEHRLLVHDCYRRTSLETIEEARRDLCTAADSLDPNKNVQTMLRLGNADLRLRLKGRLGGAIQMRTMAEMLRRATEATHGVCLPEEDELGFGWTPPDLKKTLYGASRLFDGDRRAANAFLRQFRLDYGLRVRWYVEGDTEHAALHSVFGHRWMGIEILNLRGQVVQKAGHGLAFRDSLRADLQQEVFSIVSIDGDRSDNVSTVKQAAKDDEICGRFFIYTPDFEVANFDLSELEDILWTWAVESNARPELRHRLDVGLEGVTSAEGIFAAARRAVPELAQATRGQSWGERLMRFAWEHPTKAGGIERPFLEAVKLALRVEFFDYQYTRRDLRVDPETGELVPRGMADATH